MKFEVGCNPATAYNKLIMCYLITSLKISPD
jgi:hypothetical protein